jgi:hypothetical protein
LLFLHHIAFAPHASNLLISAYTCVDAIDYAESELEEPSEQAQPEEANTNPEQGKPSCI